ncbi:MAG: hydroxymethylglutaryl-CoA synthase [Actinobacteria bacterium]|nr:hydroxymethylglutaryl-CoA synthase [Actinomycetota bacterium]
MRGIISAAAYVPYWRLERSAIAAFHGGRGAGVRSVASYDEDTTTLAVEAGRLALRAAAGVEPETLWFATSNPTYAEKTNATIAHAALRLPASTAAFDATGAVRSGVGTIRAAVRSGEDAVLVTAADIRTGPANSPDEAGGGDAGVALLIGSDRAGNGTSGVVIAEYLGGASATREFLDRWRAPGDTRIKGWEERFGETQYTALGVQAFTAALLETGLDADGIDAILVAGPHARANNAVAKKLGKPNAVDHSATIGNAGAADAALQLVEWLEQAAPAQTVALVSLADGADVLVFRTTEAISGFTPARSLRSQIEAGNTALAYNKFLAWRGTLVPNPPNRPEPARASASAAGRSYDWKFGFVGSKDRESGAVHMPPARVSFDGGNVDDMEPWPMADAQGTIVTFTIDRLVYSPSPPVIFAVVDFDGGGRLPVEVCDVVPEGIAVGDRVEMTFRRLNSSDGISNYFWKARPVR